MPRPDLIRLRSQGLYNSGLGSQYTWINLQAMPESPSTATIPDFDAVERKALPGLGDRLPGPIQRPWCSSMPTQMVRHRRVKTFLASSDSLSQAPALCLRYRIRSAKAWRPRRVNLPLQIANRGFEYCGCVKFSASWYDILPREHVKPIAGMCRFRHIPNR